MKGVEAVKERGKGISGSDPELDYQSVIKETTKLPEVNIEQSQKDIEEE